MDNQFRQYIILACLLIIAVASSCGQNSSLKSNNTVVAIRDSIIENERERVISNALLLLQEQPITVTASWCERSAGGRNDYYSEGTYWWPDSENPDGPYIRRDGINNPDNFNDHLEAIKRLSVIVGTQTSAYILTGEKRFADHAMLHMNAWFTDSLTRMNPHLLYAQAIKGVATGRGIGIIDAVHLIDVARSAKILAESSFMSSQDEEMIREWFRQFIHWLTTHPYGIDEMNWKNNHGTWWHAQVAAYADLVNDKETLDFVKERMKNVLITNQMAADGSFPLETERTKPFAYSLFNLDGMVLIAHILAEKDDNMWDFTLEDGRGIGIAINFITPYLNNKDAWPFEPDVMYWDEQPGPTPFLLLAALGYGNIEYFNLWDSIEKKPLSDEGLRNLIIKNIILLIETPDQIRIPSEN